MRIYVKLYGDFQVYAHGDQSHFGLRLSSGTTLKDCINSLSIPDVGYVALINGRRASKTTHFEEGDTLVLFPKICGG